MIREIDILGFHLYDKWLYNLRNGKRLSLFFEDNLYKNVAVYGMGIIGRQVCSELAGSSINVCCGIDRSANNMDYQGLDIIVPEQVNKREDIHVIIVTPFDLYVEIEKELMSRRNNDKIDIVSIETVIEYVSNVGV